MPYDEWEYQLIQLPHGAPDPAALTEQLNTLGAEGWELIGAEGHYVFLKREILPPAAEILPC